MIPDASTTRTVRAEAAAVFHSRRIRLDGLDGGIRRIAMAGLVALALNGIVIVALGVGLDGDVVPQFGPMPVVVVAMWLVGVALAAVVWTVAMAERGGWVGLGARLVVAVIAGNLGARLVELPDEVRAAAVPTDVVSLDVATRGGWIVVALAVLPLLFRRRWIARRPFLAGLVTASPFLVALGVYATVDSGSVTISNDFLRIAGNTTWPLELSLRAAVVKAILDGAVVVLFTAQVIVLLQLLEATRLARDAAVATVRRFSPPMWVAGVLVGTKLVLLGLASADAFSLEASDVADAIWSDGALSWAIAVAIAVGAVVLVGRTGPVRSASPEEDRRSGAAGLVAIAAIALPSALSGVAVALEHLLYLLPGDLGEAQGGWVVDRAVDLTPWLTVASFLALAVVGALVVVRSRRLRWSAGVLLLAVGVWCAPRALTLADDLRTYPDVLYPVGNPSDYVERDVQEPGWVNAATVDAAMTVAFAALLLHPRGRHPEVGRRILVVLLATTTLTYAGTLVPGGLEEGMFFHLGLVAPVAYVFCFDASGLLRSRSPSRAVLMAIGAALLGLTTASLLVATDALSASSLSYGDVGAQLAKFPLVAALLVVALRTDARREETSLTG